MSSCRDKYPRSGTRVLYRPNSNFLNAFIFSALSLCILASLCCCMNDCTICLDAFAFSCFLRVSSLLPCNRASTTRIQGPRNTHATTRLVHRNKNAHGMNRAMKLDPNNASVTKKAISDSLQLKTFLTSLTFKQIEERNVFNWSALPRNTHATTRLVHRNKNAHGMNRAMKLDPNNASVTKKAISDSLQLKTFLTSLIFKQIEESHC
mmetsp:Transcript_18487/g.37237  ORF Transcript_18487/g.37237 Transcript_18487/m.37237 type:complete len:207 (+) Transcript_18487:695-1315(+)